MSPSHDGLPVCLEVLLYKGADANQVNVQIGSFPLLTAAQNGHAGCVEVLLDKGADTKQVHAQSGISPLRLAMQLGHEGCVLMLKKDARAHGRAHGGRPR